MLLDTSAVSFTLQQVTPRGEYWMTQQSMSDAFCSSGNMGWPNSSYKISQSFSPSDSWSWYLLWKKKSLHVCSCVLQIRHKAEVFGSDLVTSRPLETAGQTHNLTAKSPLRMCGSSHGGESAENSASSITPNWYLQMVIFIGQWHRECLSPCSPLLSLKPCGVSYIQRPSSQMRDFCAVPKRNGHSARLTQPPLQVFPPSMTDIMDFSPLHLWKRRGPFRP